MSRTTLIVLMSCFVLTANAAGPRSPGSRPATEGRRQATDIPKPPAWIDRLVGQFSHEGSMERYNADGSVDRAEAHGGSLCVRFDEAEAVQCQVNVNWGAMPGATAQAPADGVSLLASGVVVYGVNHAGNQLGHMQVNGEGVATLGKGSLVDDTLVSRDPCADFPDCVRVLRLEAPPDSNVVRMRVDLERDGKLQVRQDLQWIRQSSLQVSSAAAPTAAVAARPLSAALSGGSAQVPADIDAWLRQLPGEFRFPTPARSSTAEAECQSIGTGPGVRCVMYMAWPENGISLSRKHYQVVNSSFLMYGFDPVGGGIAVALVVPRASGRPAGFMAGQLKGDRLSYVSDCGRPPCSTVESMTIGPEGQWVVWQVFPGTSTLTVSWGMDRMPGQVVAGTAGTAPGLDRPPAMSVRRSSYRFEPNSGIHQPASRIVSGIGMGITEPPRFH